MFWSDWGRAAKIEKCGMNGNLITREILINRDIVWPNGLTIDYSGDRLWWTDARLGTVESTDLNGLDRRVTVRSWQIRGTFGIAVLQDSIYLTKRHYGRKILKIDDKINGTKTMVTIARYLYSPRGIVTYDRLKQPVPEGECLSSGFVCMFQVSCNS